MLSCTGAEAHDNSFIYSGNDTDPQGREVIFVDEFNTDGIPDPTKWTLCPVGTSDWCNQMSESYDQA